ncbi:MAG: transcriptional regulator [Gammaproteobacteria bacterium]|nr:MAG: transcriptional regulator [Gammaproteobacteria bacterium]
MSLNAKVLNPEKVKKHRADNGYSQELLAKASGLSLRTIQRIEKDGKASAETQLALAATFNISPKELFQVSATPDVNWKWRNIMQSAFALLVVSGTILFGVFLAGGINIYIDTFSLIFVVLFMYSGTTIAFGTQGLVKSITSLRFLFTNDIKETPASQYLALILAKQIWFLYGGAFIGVLIGFVAIYSNMAEIDAMGPAYAVNMLVLLYAAIFSEGILRPLSVKLAHCDSLENIN